MLSASWWQGIAGIAQIIAAILSVWAIREIYKERQNTVSPDWEEIKTGTYPKTTQEITSYNISFVNTGYGTAHKIVVEYLSFSETGPSPINQPSGSILPEHQFEVSLLWKGVLLPSGLINISCLNRYNHIIKS